MVLRFGTHSSIYFKEDFLPPVGLRETEKLNVFLFSLLFTTNCESLNYCYSLKAFSLYSYI